MSETRMERTAQRVIDQLGVAFRLHGRMPDIALDCIGLAAHAAEMAVPSDYCLRGDFEQRISEYMKNQGFEIVKTEIPVMDGAVILAQTSPNQMHIMIAVHGGFVHAHAGLRRVVMMPSPCPWPILCHWQDRRN